MNKELEALNMLKALSKIDSDNETKNQIDIAYKEIKKSLKALEIIVKKANIRLFEMNGRYYFRTTNNLYEISKEKYDLLKDVLL